MNPRGPEFKPKQSAEEIVPFGYTVARIKSFTPEPRTSISAVQQRAEHRNTAAESSTPREMTAMEIKTETIALSSMFIPQVWEKIKKWSDEHAPGLALNRSGSLIPIPKNQFIQTATAAESSKAFVNLVNSYTESVFLELTKQWERDQKEKLLHPELVSGAERGILEAYKRYKKVLGFGMNNISNDEGEPVESTGEHILGGLATGRAMIFKSFEILVKVFKTQYHRSPTKEDMLKLIESAKPLILTIAQSDLQTFGLIEDSITREEGNFLPGFRQLNAGFDPGKFTFSKQGNNFSLEIRPEVLDEIEEELKTTGHSVLHTGCPALFAKGQNGKNVVSELYDMFAHLYKEFYIDTHSEFK